MKITLSTITNSGALQDFEHAGITIQQNGVFIENSMADYGILFSPDTTTEVELTYTNVGFELLKNRLSSDNLTYPRVGVSQQIKQSVLYLPL